VLKDLQADVFGSYWWYYSSARGQTADSNDCETLVGKLKDRYLAKVHYLKHADIAILNYDARYTEQNSDENRLKDCSNRFLEDFSEKAGMTDAGRRKRIEEAGSQKLDGKTAVAQLIGGVFAVWSIVDRLEKERANEPLVKAELRTRLNIWRKPHSAQVLSIIRMLELDRKELDSPWKGTCASIEQGKKPHHLAQVKTGQGKSVVLGTLATVLALLNKDVW
jgi:hypothetical protein